MLCRFGARGVAAYDPLSGKAPVALQAKEGSVTPNKGSVTGSVTKQAAWRQRNADKYKAARREYMRRYRASKYSPPKDNIVPTTPDTPCFV